MNTSIPIPGKARILIVGEIVNDTPQNFVFDCYGKIAGLEIGTEPKWGGWTLDELREVVARPSEFCEPYTEP